MAKLLWKPSEERIRNSNMYRFMEIVNGKFDLKFTEYNQLHHWSIENIPDFWAAMWDFAQIVHSRAYESVVDDLSKMPGTQWFPGAKLNFAENILRYRDDHQAIVFWCEKELVRRLSYVELYDQVARLAKSLKEAGVQKGDRVAGFMPNIPETIIAMLAATSLGAVWSSCSPDFGIKGVLDRFGQIEPKILFTADGYYYNGKTFDSLERIAGILKELPSIQKTVVISFTRHQPEINHVPKSVHWEDFMSSEEGLELEFVQMDFNSPLYVMYSSGTTGEPKCMVQSVGGILINQLKEHLLHIDLKRDDVVFYFTTCGWMMWNWLTCALGTGATIVLYDGSPFHPDPGALWKMAQEEKITVFGTSASYIVALEKAGAEPGQDYNLSSLRTICSTGSPLPKEGFDYAYREIKKDMQLASISGGSDLNGCFAAGCPTLPVYAGELQCRALGMKVKAYNEIGEEVYDQTGELVCEAPFPSMPIYFWNDQNNEKYLNAYFRKYPGVWHHGDFIEITSQGGVIIYGRSDATLNPGGVRLGTSDIYSMVENFEEITDSLVVSQDWENDVRIILFVKLTEGHELNEDLKNRIKQTIKENASPRHIPAKIIPIADIPYTINMKKVELAVRNVIHGRPVTNKDALANSEALDLYTNIPELQV